MLTTPPADAQYTHHAVRRMNARALDPQVIELVQQYGRQLNARGAVYCVVGKKELKRFADTIDLSAADGVHVLVSTDGWVLTTYRNRGFHPSRYRKPTHRPARLAKLRRRHRTH